MSNLTLQRVTKKNILILKLNYYYRFVTHTLHWLTTFIVSMVIVTVIVTTASKKNLQKKYINK